MNDVPSLPIPSSSTDASAGAPEHPLPPNRFYSVEFPGYVKEDSVPRVIQHLGGKARVDGAFRKNTSEDESLLELNWRPENPFAHPVKGSALYANNLLLKVRKRMKRKADGAEDPGYKGDFTAEVVGFIPKTIRFRRMYLF